MSKTKKTVEKTYNQKAKEALLDVSKKDFWFIYKNAVMSSNGLLPDGVVEEIDCMSLMNIYAEEHNGLFAEYILCGILTDEDFNKLLNSSVSRECSYAEHLQFILNALDAGSTVDQILVILDNK